MMALFLLLALQNMNEMSTPSQVSRQKKHKSKESDDQVSSATFAFQPMD
jgi:hypothetical protein